MKNKVGILIVIIVCFMTACSSQESIDMAIISLPCASNIIFKDSIQFDKKRQFKELQIYYTQDSKLLNFYGIDLDFEVTNEFQSQNNVSIYKDETSLKVKLIEFEIYTLNESRKLYRVLIDELGIPLFYNNRNQHSFTGVWENPKATYVFKKSNSFVVGGVKTEKSWLYIIDNNDIESIKHFTNSINFEQFLDSRAKKNTKNYTYRTWATEMAAEGDDKFLKYLDKNKPL